MRLLTMPGTVTGAGRIRPAKGVLVIEVRGLTKDYGAKRAVDGVTFTVEPGIVTGFLGPNGAGKSTTMRLILGLDRHCDGGRVMSCGSALIAPVLALEGLANPNLRWNTTNIHAGTGNLLFSDGTVRETTSPTLLQALKDSQDTSSNNHILPPR